MIVCTACGAENMDGTRFCVKCGAGLSAAPDPGAWRAPSGNLYDEPKPSVDFGAPGSYAPSPVAYPSYDAPPGSMIGGGQMNYAMWGDRALAALIDGALVAAVVFVLVTVLSVIGGGISAIGGGDIGEALGGSVCCLAIFLAPVSAFLIGLYNKVYLLSNRGFSIGQGVMNLKVVDANSNLLSTGTAVLRLLVQIGLGFVPFLGWILVLLNLLWPLWDPQRQTLHDKAVGSFVIKTR